VLSSLPLPIRLHVPFEDFRSLRLPLSSRAVAAVVVVAMLF
jgi:hypothetical protein